MLSDGVHNSSFTSSDPPSPVPVQDPVYVNRSVLLPAYRPSPNYESVMRIRMIQASVMQVTVFILFIVDMRKCMTIVSVCSLA